MQLLLLFFLFFCVRCESTKAQATVEAAGATSASAAAAAKAKPLGWPSITLPDGKGKSPHLAASSDLPSDVANRRALEKQAGENAGKLLLRSVPSTAQVWIDGAFVGNSPMLLLLAPGKYRVELRGQRMEYAVRVVDLLPRETREIALTLAARYPTRASVR
jgi:hypothetical protein